MPSIERDGWTLLSAEERHARSPSTFVIPSRAERESLSRGHAAQLLFDIETRESGRVTDRGVDRMWVIVTDKTATGYVGILDSDPGVADGLKLRPGDLVSFGPEHIVRIATPPQAFLIEKFGPDFMP